MSSSAGSSRLFTDVLGYFSPPRLSLRSGRTLSPLDTTMRTLKSATKNAAQSRQVVRWKRPPRWSHDGVTSPKVIRRCSTLRSERLLKGQIRRKSPAGRWMKASLGLIVYVPCALAFRISSTWSLLQLLGCIRVNVRVRSCEFVRCQKGCRTICSNSVASLWET